MVNNIKTAILILFFCISSIASAMSVDEFNTSLSKLEGKSKDDVVAVLGKPAGYKSGGDVEYFRYEGIKDKYTGKTLTASVVYFKNGKIDTKGFPPRHYFDKMPF